jgi:hypothetical protein
MSIRNRCIYKFNALRIYGHETLGIHYLGNAERARRIVVWYHVTSLRLRMPQAYMPTESTLIYAMDEISMPDETPSLSSPMLGSLSPGLHT